LEHIDSVAVHTILVLLYQLFEFGSLIHLEL
jgi:hypothetical protein